MFDTLLFSYLDPFTGSLVLQVLATAFLGVAAFFKPIWNLVLGKKTAGTNMTDDWESTADAADAVDSGDSND